MLSSLRSVIMICPLYAFLFNNNTELTEVIYSIGIIVNIR